MTSPPFLSLVTPTYHRPRALEGCMASVAAQSDVARVEHLVLPDYVGIGLAGVYARLACVAPAVHGQYVYLLADDDVLAAPTVVASLRDFVEAEGYPPVVIVAVVKGGTLIDGAIPPTLGAIDLGNLVVRGDVWQRHAGDYGRRYEGDYDFALALYRAGHEFARLPLRFATGGVSRGARE